MRVVARVDQLRIDPHLVCHALDTAFQHMSNPERLANITQIPRCLSLVLRHTCSADYFEVRDLGQISENFILNAVSEKRVLLVIAQTFKRKHCDAFVRSEERRVGKECSCGWSR